MNPKKNLQQALVKASKYLQTGNRELAYKHLLKFSKNAPKNASIRNDIGIFFQQNNMPIKAELFYRDSLSLDNNQSSIYFNLGVIYQNMGKIHQAIEAYKTATEKSPDYTKAFANLGYLYNEIGDEAKCKEACLTAKRLEPDNPQVNHMIAALGIEKPPETADQQYIKNLYNDYAKTYDSHLSVTLKSRVPQLVYDATIKVTDKNHQAKTMLDLGCGTGICGAFFSNNTDTLDGVDLSEEMIAVASNKNIYDNLYTQDIVDFLKDKINIYDIIFSSDVLIYIGNLSELLQQAYTALKDGGVFTFSTEALIDSDKDFALDSTGRYKHADHYIRNITKETNFTILNSDETTLRQQNKENVIGRIYVLEKKL